MTLLVLYTEYSGQLRILGIYSDTHSMERRFNFKPIERDEYTLEDIQRYFEANPIFFGKTFTIEKALEGDDALQLFARKLYEAIQLYPEDKVLLSLSVEHRGNNG